MTMLHLIDYLLSNYSTNPRVQNLVNNLKSGLTSANPNGTYYGGNNSVSGARRYNANGYDLNRSFPDHWELQVLQLNQKLPSLPICKCSSLFLSANFHGGSEVVNYPWMELIPHT